MSLFASAMVGTFLAAAVAAVCVVGATSSGGGTAGLDRLGAGLVSTLTAPDPYAWHQDQGTVTRTVAQLIKRFEAANLKAKFPSRNDLQKRFSTPDHQRRERNRIRLDAALGSSLGTGGGVLRGLHVKFSTREFRDVSYGATVQVQLQNPVATVGDVQVFALQFNDPLGGGAFEGRIYAKPYKAQTGARIGTAYAILDAGAMGGGGGGTWILLAPILVAGLAGGFLLMSASKASAGLRSLGRDLEAIGRGRIETRVAVNAGGEVGAAQWAAQRMAAGLQELGPVLGSGEGEIDEALAKQLQQVTQIHANFRPDDPPRIPGHDLETLFKPAREIGGDIFDYIELGSHQLAFVLADTGEQLSGMPAALVMATTRAYLRAAIGAEGGPATWLKAVNRRLARDLRTGTAVTALVALYDHAEYKLTLASAGHKPAIVWRAGKTATINPGGVALGLDVGPVFDKTLEETSIQLKKNDRVVFYTDGAVTAQNEAGDPFGDERLVEAIRRHGGMNSAAFVNLVAGAVDTFLAGQPQPDDVTISTIKRLK